LEHCDHRNQCLDLALIALSRGCGNSFGIEGLLRVSIIAGYGSILRRSIFAKIKKNLIPVAPAPAFGGIVAFDNGVTGAMKMRGRVAVGRLIATANVTASAANPQM
jgi:hypothetical protein